MQDDTGRLERREISVDRMSYKDGEAKHAQDYCDHFNHSDVPLQFDTGKSGCWFLQGRKVV